MRQLVATLVLVFWVQAAFGAPMSVCDFDLPGYEWGAYSARRYFRPARDRWSFGHRHGWGGMFFRGSRNDNRLEVAFEELVDDYESQVESSDFVGSDDYYDLLDSLQELVDRQERLTSWSETRLSSVDRLMEFTEDRVSYYEDLLADYSTQDGVSSRFIEGITRRLDTSAFRLDDLASQRETLQEKNEEFLSFRDEMAAYLDEISLTDEATTTALALLETEVTSASDELTFSTIAYLDEASLTGGTTSAALAFLGTEAASASDELTFSGAAVSISSESDRHENPEPSSLVLLASGVLVFGGTLLRRRRPSRDRLASSSPGR